MNLKPRGTRRRERRDRRSSKVGRGIGRVAAHEVAHQIVGPGGKHNDADEDSYEYSSPARASHYYGELHWTVWWPDLQRKVGR